MWFSLCQHFQAKLSSLGISESALNIFFPLRPYYYSPWVLNIVQLLVLIFRQMGFITTRVCDSVSDLFHTHTRVHARTHTHTMCVTTTAAVVTKDSNSCK